MLRLEAGGGLADIGRVGIAIGREQRPRRVEMVLREAREIDALAARPRLLDRLRLERRIDRARDLARKRRPERALRRHRRFEGQLRRVAGQAFDQGFVFGKKVYIEGLGIYTVMDLMNKKYINRIDVFLGNKKEAFSFGAKKVKISLLEID